MIPAEVAQMDLVEVPVVARCAAVRVPPSVKTLVVGAFVPVT